MSRLYKEERILLELQNESLLLLEWLITTVDIDCKIKNGDIKAGFWEITSQDMLYKSKAILKGETKKKDLGFHEENLIFINESLAFVTKKLL